jgi:hypothetical protein
VQTYSVVQARQSFLDVDVVESMKKLHSTSEYRLFGSRADLGFLHKLGHNLAFYLLSSGIPFVCIKATGIFPFLQNRWMIDMFRQHFGESRPQLDSPFYRFEPEEAEPLAFLLAALVSNFADFDAFLIDPLISIEFSHDEWIRVRANDQTHLCEASNVFQELGCSILSAH